MLDPRFESRFLADSLVSRHRGWWGACVCSASGQRRHHRRRDPREAQGESWLTAAIPMVNPYCSCKLTHLRHGQGGRGRGRVHRPSGQSASSPRTHCKRLAVMGNCKQPFRPGCGGVRSSKTASLSHAFRCVSYSISYYILSVLAVWFSAFRVADEALRPKAKAEGRRLEAQVEKRSLHCLCLRCHLLKHGSFTAFVCGVTF